MRWAASRAPRRCAASAQYERDHGVRKASQVPWKERDHALFVAFAPVQAPRYVCAVVVEHGGADAAAAARRSRRRSAATCCSKRSAATRRAGCRSPMRWPRVAPDRRRRPGSAAVGLAAAASNDEFPRHRPARTDACRQVSRHPVGAAAAARAIAGIGFAMLYSAANGEFQPWASRQMIRFAVVLVADDRGRAYRHARTGSAPPIGSTRRRCCWSSRSICAASSAWGRSAGSISARCSCSPPRS